LVVNIILGGGQYYVAYCNDGYQMLQKQLRVL
jgi:hypothetical protein